MNDFLLGCSVDALDATELCMALSCILKPCVGEQHGLCWLKNSGQDVVGVLPMWHMQVRSVGVKDGAHSETAVYTRAFYKDLSARTESTPCYGEPALTQKNPVWVMAQYIAKHTAGHPKSHATPYTKAQLNQKAKPHAAKPHKAKPYAEKPDAAHASFEADRLGLHKNKCFTGGLMGFVGYDYAASRMGVFASQQNAPSKLLMYFGHYDVYLKKLAGYWFIFYEPTGRRLAGWLQRRLFESAALLQEVAHSGGAYQAAEFYMERMQAVWQESAYAHAFTRIQNYLQAGDCYQVNLAQQFKAAYTGSPVEVLSSLDAATNAPFAGFLQVADFALVACSPELFVSFAKDAAGRSAVTTKPIKGTLPRLANTKADAQQIDKLVASEKDRAENLMIVDLLRNDLSKHAKVGSVKVSNLFEVESFAQVHHMVSTIQATLADDTSSLDVLFDALPGGSITGAPKLRAMQIIAELEAAPRGAYCGSLGYINFDGTGVFNILIRSLEFDGGDVSLWAGGGITVASECEAEYQECLDKVSGILDALKQFCKPDMY